jgi:DNA-binding transcriptional ArsR family regulator
MDDTNRLRSLLSEDVEDCCEADVQDRLAELEEFAAAVPDGGESDVQALNTLGNDTRYRIVRILAAAADELCVCELTPLLDVTDGAVSHALSDLRDAGLVARRKEGTWRYYRTTERAEALVGALDGTRTVTEASQESAE